jgi:Holliday junction resolvase RusA-like endonuclease
MPTFELDLCPSVNALYRNVRGRGRVKTARYRSWIRGQLKALVAQRARPVVPPVAILIELPDNMRGDPDNRTKAILDLLVAASIIPDDNIGIIKQLFISSTPRTGMSVTVESIRAKAA